jgi:exodeoxyribonuclease VII large subunit
MSGQGFFEFREQVTRRNKPAATLATETSAATPPLTVSQLTSRIELAIKTQLPGSISVQGEVSNFRAVSAGHYFFSLKDATDNIDCVMWRSDNASLKFQIRDGMELILTGTVGVYRQQSKYRLYAKKVQPVGQGALELAFKQLQQKLQREGLFDAKRKKPIPSYPLRIVMITSAQAAALQDMLKILRRFSFLRLMVYHTLVQGTEAAAQIAAAIELVNRRHKDVGGVDLILLARGGGSLEDLWSFNEEVVARAVAASTLPIITGIGHEVDVTISDLVADHHAHTPTEAAQVATRFWREAEELIQRQSIRLSREARQIIANARQRLTIAERHEIFRLPQQRIARLTQRIDNLHRQLIAATDRRMSQSHRRLDQLQSRLQQQRTQIFTRLRERITTLHQRLATRIQIYLRSLRERLQQGQIALRDSHPKHRLQLGRQRLGQMEVRIQRSMTQDVRRRIEKITAIAARLEAINPSRVLQRGYSLTTLHSTGEVIRDAAALKVGDHLITQFATGQVESVVEPEK